MKKGKIARFRIQRRLEVELPGLGKPGALERRPYPPGENGNKRRKFSDYALRLEEKQKLRFNYELREEQLRRFIRQSKKGGSVNWVDKLCGLLELRLDNVVFRLGFAVSIRSARQLVGHGHVLVDGRKVNIPSYVCRPGQKISLHEKAHENQIVLAGDKNPRMDVPDFLKKSEDKAESYTGVIHAVPSLAHVPFQFDAGLFTEYYAARNI